MSTAARERSYSRSLVLEDTRAVGARGQRSQAGKILETHQENSGRIHVLLVRQPVGS
jgi:hypothetical protein